MKILEFNKDLYVLRLEYFGGIIINKLDMQKYEISKYDALFLLGISRNIPAQLVLQYINEKFGIGFSPDIATYCELKILLHVPMRMDEDSTQMQKAIDELDNLYEGVAKINHLVSPVELTIYPSLKCSLNCDFCFVGKKRHIMHTEYSADEWLGLVRTFVKEGTVSVSVLGGEPSMYSEIVPLLEGLDKVGIRVTMTSNGQTWSEGLYNTIVDSENITPIFSIESLKADSELIKKRKQANCEITVKLIKKLRGQGKQCRINAVYTNQTDEEIFDLVDFCAENDIEKFSVAICFGCGTGLPTIYETNALGNRVREYIREKGYSLYFTIEGCMAFSSYTDLDGKIVSSNLQIKQYGCECGNTILEIMPDGSMYPCAAYISHGNPIGNAFQNSWKEIWYNSVDLNQFRSSVCTDHICEKCSCFHFCNGGCPAYKALIGIREVYKIADDRCLKHIIKRTNNGGEI